MAAASSLGAVCEQRDQASVFATASSEQDRPAKGSVDKARVLVPGKKPSSRGDYSLHTQTVHVTRSPTPFQLVFDIFALRV